MHVKRTVKRAAVAAGRLLSRNGGTPRRVVLCYHSVHPDRPYASTSPQLFERHIAWLREHCHPASFSELAASPWTGDDVRPAVAITFDDGHEDNYCYALPILLKYGFSATFFVTTGYIDRRDDVVRRLEYLMGCSRSDLCPMNWVQIRELVTNGMSVGSHTVTHPNLARLDTADAESELRVSRERIGEEVGTTPDLFAYPFGKPRVHHTRETRELVRAAGYRLAASVTFRALSTTNSAFEVPRFFADGDSLAKLTDKVLGAYDPLGRWQEHAPMWLMARVSPDDFKR